MKPLEGSIALVAGATRGAGRGIACALGAAGATVYCTGRSVRGKPATPNRPETIEETAEMVSARGGVGIHVQVDHTEPEQVAALCERVDRDQGRLDILVNDVWGGDALTEWGKPFWELSLDKGLLMLERAVNAHIITSRYGVPLVLKSERGLVVEVTDGDDEMNAYYRGNLFYDLAKIAPMRLAFAMAHELRDTNVTAVALSPGFLRSEFMLEHFGVSEENWQDAVEKDEYFAESETPFFIGRAIVALATDPHVSEKSGGSFATWTLAKEYGFTDVDGRRPDMGGKIKAEMEERWDRLVAAIRERLRAEGLDPDSVFRHDLSTLKLSGLLEPGAREGPRYTWPLQVPELWRADPPKLAAEFLDRYRSRREG
ncbi:MAG: SDR family NAD(P)-dependent oxidoreductase [Gemmatimonadetes bacterium]|uniref:SDR family NAD(P)-dependent oxidoreductase n=1 Tax=Candidatus Kutchimonas denitrificans TaxID=3056748 RepID=A0AAE4ZAX2_9BACT|nr:SDR family NAD(P)-dependent oxidoreductase [Gemmatimonadota bacterium]NIR74080.1 SDR family NAD(P)-dependent oxidoreductase [Candidatus Kutchimonas denitrificans]NIS01642.1 SDR family NAD(P)-dependent oxidoreductase [Gemmatimonadota bacterium]NIT67380.1 SDR family NAD(P)-dependent oxidoreductase [Gemmatimonadota bacterium]NIU52743.1 SDR family NAD(P)-dependent oxidoreductase [Gemmatimonadota bacterium]